MDATPFYDIKPSRPYADCKPAAVGGFAARPKEASLTVDCPTELLLRLPEDKRAALLAVLAQDPRPQYQGDPDRVYGMAFAGLEVRFRVEEQRLTVTEIALPPSGT